MGETSCVSRSLLSGAFVRQGCYLTVSRASDPSLVNVTGIVLRETANMFQVRRCVVGFRGVG